MISQLLMGSCPHLIIGKCHWNSTSHKTSPPDDHLKSERIKNLYQWLLTAQEILKKNTCWQKSKHTCCLKLIFSFCDFLVKLDKKDKGKTNAALPMSTRANNTELTITDVPGLQRLVGTRFINLSLILILRSLKENTWHTYH